MWRLTTSRGSHEVRMMASPYERLECRRLPSLKSRIRLKPWRKSVTVSPEKLVDTDKYR